MTRLTLIPLFLLLAAIPTGCKKKKSKDPCYDNNKTKACEMKCARGEKKACAKWCHFTETIEACTKACDLKDKDSCTKLATLKKEKGKETKHEKVSKKQQKIAEPYCIKGCQKGSKGEMTNHYGNLVFTKLKAKASSAGKAPKVAECTDDCVEQLIENCPKPEFQKQYPKICKELTKK